MSDYKCYVTIDNTRNPNELVLVSSQPKDGIFVCRRKMSLAEVRCNWS